MKKTRRRRRLSRRLGKARKDKSRHTPHVGGGKPLIPISKGGMEVAMGLGDGGVNSMRDKLTKDKTKPAAIFNSKRLERVAIGDTQACSYLVSLALAAERAADPAEEAEPEET